MAEVTFVRSLCRALGLAYDLCHDAWSKATRQTVADSLLDLATRAYTPIECKQTSEHLHCACTHSCAALMRRRVYDG